jgi:hypothetical protein
VRRFLLNVYLKVLIEGRYFSKIIIGLLLRRVERYPVGCSLTGFGGQIQADGAVILERIGH